MGKSLGTIVFPTLTLESYDHGAQEVVVRIDGGGNSGRRSVKLRVSVWGARAIVALGWEIVKKYGEAIEVEKRRHEQLKKYTGYKEGT